MPYYPVPPCQRPSCEFPRKWQRKTGSKSRLLRYCSDECAVYMSRARIALRDEDKAEALELNRLWGAMNARKRSTDPVPEVFTRSLPTP